MIHRHDVIFVEMSPIRATDYAEVTSWACGSPIVHAAIAWSNTRAVEMHVRGLRTIEIAKYGTIWVLRPPAQYQPGLEAALRAGIDRYQWEHYAWFQSMALGIERLTGIRIPWQSGGNCSEFVAYVVSLVMKLSRDPDAYDPARLFDALILAGWQEVYVGQSRAAA